MSTVKSQYRVAAWMVLRRMKWDLSFQGLLQKRRIRKWRNQYQGQKAIILCNGPSLNNVDFDRLQSEDIFTIGLNKINLLFDRTPFRPSCVVAVNPHVISQNRDFFTETTIPLFLDYKNARRQKVSIKRNMVLIPSIMPSGRFSTKLENGLNQGFTVTFVAMQIAYHIGFRRIGLVGCDHSFASKGPPNRTVTASSKDESHFDHRYFSRGQLWQLPDLIGSEFHYQIAGKAFADAGGEIVNCTEGGKLETYRRESLDSFLERRDE